MKIIHSVTNRKNVKGLDLESPDALKTIRDNEKTIVTAIEILRKLEENGTLQLLHTFVDENGELISVFVNELEKPRFAGTLENLTKLLLYVSKLRIEDLYYLTEKLNRGMEEANRSSGSGKTSYMGLIKALKEPEINRSVTMILRFLRGMGKE